MGDFDFKLANWFDFQLQLFFRADGLTIWICKDQQIIVFKPRIIVFV